MTERKAEQRCGKCRGFGSTKGSERAPWEHVDCVECGGTGCVPLPTERVPEREFTAMQHSAHNDGVPHRRFTKAVDLVPPCRHCGSALHDENNCRYLSPAPSETPSPIHTPKPERCPYRNKVDGPCTSDTNGSPWCDKHEALVNALLAETPSPEEGEMLQVLIERSEFGELETSLRLMPDKKYQPEWTMTFYFEADDYSLFCGSTWQEVVTKAYRHFYAAAKEQSK